MNVLSPNCRKEWLADGRILSYTFTGLDNIAVDAFADDFSFEAEVWPGTRSLLCVLNFQTGRTIPGEYAIRRAVQLSRTRPHLPTQIAIITDNPNFAQIIAPILRIIPTNPQRTYDIFTELASAIEWLLADGDTTATIVPPEGY
ncbi:MAG: hypothetical protein H7175_04635 [Burkholderiales bacterium]|nr:hypothetical protein [Anaerolineae bacterium]